MNNEYYFNIFNEKWSFKYNPFGGIIYCLLSTIINILILYLNLKDTKMILLSILLCLIGIIIYGDLLRSHHYQHDNDFTFLFQSKFQTGVIIIIYV